MESLADEVSDTPLARGDDAPESPEPAGLDAARISLRSAGYCVVCDRIVEVASDGGCTANPSHPVAGISGIVRLSADEPVPVLPSFNWAAFLVPPVWGPAHGQWAGVIFLPIWLFADSAVASASQRGGAATVGAAVIVVLTAAAQAWFGKRANGLAWRHVAGRTSIEQFAAAQRRWAIAMVPVAALMFAWATYYQLTLAPTLQR